MSYRKTAWTVVALLVVISLVTSCAPKETIVKETVIVEKPVEKVVKETVIVTEEKVVKETVVVTEEKVVTPTPEPTGPAKIVFWQDTSAYQEFWEQLAKDFMAENPDIEVEVRLIPSVGWTQALLASFVAGNEPDVCWMSFDFVVDLYAKYKCWLPLDDYVKGWEGLDHMTPMALNNMTFDGQLVGLQASNHWQGLFIRKSWLEAVGWTKKDPYLEDWDDLLELATKFTFEDPDGNGQDDTWGYEMFGSLSRNYATIQYEYMMNAAGQELALPRQLNFNTERGQEVLQFMQDLIYEHKVVPPDTANYTHVEFYRDVQAGRVGIGRMADWNVGRWNEWLDHDYVVTPYPPFKKGETAYQSSVFRGLVISRNSKFPDATAKFAKFLVSKPAQEVIYKGSGMIVRRDLDWEALGAAAEDMIFRTTPVDQVYLVRDPKWTADVKAALAKHIQSAMLDENMSHADALAAAEEEILPMWE